MGSARAWVAAHRKLLAVVAGAALTVAIQVWGTSNPYISLAVLAATSLGVYGVRNAGAATPAQAPAPAQAPGGGSSRLVSRPAPPSGPGREPGSGS